MSNESKKDKQELVASITKGDILREIEHFNSQDHEARLFKLLINGYNGLSADTFLKLYDFALNGDLSVIFSSNEWFDDATCACALVFELFHDFQNVSGVVYDHDAILTVHDGAYGRIKIDFARLGKCADADNDFISLRQIAILCRMKEASVRNALSKDSEAPVGEKEGKQVYFDPLEAHRWMLKRRGYRPTELSAETDSIYGYTDITVWGPAQPEEPDSDDT